LNPTSERGVSAHNLSNGDVEAPSKDEKSQRLAELMNLISDEKLLLIFRTIFLASGDTSEILMSRLKLSRKQYYSRISSLTRAGLVKREKGRYFVTAFGKVIHSAQLDFEAKFQSAIDNYWKLKAIDSLQMFSGEEKNKVICELISNQDIRNVLLDQEPQPQLYTKATIKKIDVLHEMLPAPQLQSGTGQSSL
jgi:DNA-binding HxlR family transcriptional regulator